MSARPKWRSDEKLARFGMVNSADHRKPKYAKLQAAKNLQWSGRLRFNAMKMISKVVCHWEEGGAGITLGSLDAPQHSLQPQAVEKRVGKPFLDVERMDSRKVDLYGRMLHRAS